jgi:hypothetical protein
MQAGIRSSLRPDRQTDRTILGLSSAISTLQEKPEEEADLRILLSAEDKKGNLVAPLYSLYGS